MFTAIPNWALTSDPAINITTTAVQEHLAEAIIQEAVEAIMVVRPEPSATTPVQDQAATGVPDLPPVLLPAVQVAAPAVLLQYAPSQEEATNS